jgi:FtsP/CotA-like multicopper oxidase with cupredoxin domain
MAGMAMPGQAASKPAPAPMAGMAKPGSATSGSAMPNPAMPGMAMGGAGGAPHNMADMKPAAGGMQMGNAGKPDLNDFDFDAYLANDRTLADPEVIRTERGGRVRLRVINAAASTAFWLDLGATVGTVIAVDGSPVKPVTGSRFPMSEAQRLDILVEVKPGSVVPVFAQRVGDRARTGIVLAAPGAAVAKLSGMAEREVGPTDLSLEERLTALEPLTARSPDVQLRAVLSGTMAPYAWRVNGRAWADREPLQVAKGQRVVLDIVNQTPMAHPMHLHGHAFQVMALNGKALNGAVRDTIQLPIMGSASVAFDADNPGRWLFHCHNMLHMETGMITELVYKS